MSEPDWWSELMAVSDIFPAEDDKEVAFWQLPKTPPVDQYGFPTVDNWEEPEDEEVPLMSRLNHLAHVFARNTKVLTPSQRQRFLELLETKMASGDEDSEHIAVTSFFDVLQNVSEHTQADTTRQESWKRYNGFNLQDVWDELGPASQQYLRERDEFWGVKSPEWMRRKDG